MKKFLLLLFWISFIINSFSQDVIVMVNGDTLNVIVTKNGPELIEFKYPNENVLNTDYKANIHKIIFSSGREEIYNEKLKVEKEEDWEKVVITFNESDILGLTEIGEVKANSNFLGWGTKKDGKIAMKKLKIAAVEIGASIILVTDGWDLEKNKPERGYKERVKLIGKAYR